MYIELLKEGLRLYKYKNSQLKPIDYVETQKKGAVFIYYSKVALIAAHGLVVTSVEAIEGQQHKITHWTPNVYRYGRYSNGNRSTVEGHSEMNLRQINTFIVDIDTKKQSYGEILMACFDEIGYIPTLIIESDKGYQIYFVLQTPVYVTSKSNFQAVRIAKIISKNIRECLEKALIGIDTGCNHFGIARFPNKENIVYFEKEHQYTFEQWMNWSMKVSADKQCEEKENQKVIVFPKRSVIRQVDEPWFDLLIRQRKIIGGDGRLGRNNTVFTLALAHYSSEISYDSCYDSLCWFNEQLKEPLEEKEYRKVIQSAYSGNYQAANREFIFELCQEWISSDIQEKDLFIPRKSWWKFKKPREQRKYSHIEEWKSDFLKYLNQEQGKETGYLECTKKELQEAIAIPIRSLDNVLKQLRKENKIVYTSKRGRGGGLVLASVHVLLKRLLEQTRKEQETYMKGIRTYFSLTKQEITRLFFPYIRKTNVVKQLNLLELDTG
ncbi:TPA: primase C-terminal domain-containing protein [Enterococcus faecalis]|nr:primase C-terminal domain-containing protein [Enterococcus faecalis]